MHRFSDLVPPLGLVALAACPVEQTYADLIKEHGNTYASESATHTSTTAESSTSDPGVPTTTNGSTASASTGDSSGGSTADTALTAGDASSTTEPWVDEPPELGDLAITPNPILAAGFIGLSVECTDDVGVLEVRFRVDGELLVAATEPPFTAKWLVKSQDQVGEHVLAVECEDTAGHVVSTGEEISVALPAPGSIAWSQVHAAYQGHAEAADAAAAADGSWWVCGSADNVGGGTAVWVAHYSPAGKELFSKTISRGKDQTGRCGGIAVASDDGHRAVLTGGFGPTAIVPSLWAALVDETEVSPVLAESNDALSAYYGNDVLVNKYGQFEIAGHRFVGGADWDMVHQIYEFSPGDDELTSYAGLTYGEKGKFDAASAIVENLDGTVTLVGAVTKNLSLRVAAIKLDEQHQIAKTDGWPFLSATEAPAGAWGMDGAVDSSGMLQVTGWRRKSANDPSRVINLRIDPQGHLVGGIESEDGGEFKGDNVGHSVTFLSDGSYVGVWSVEIGPADRDIWLRRYYAGSPQLVFQSPFGLLDEPRRVKVNAFDQMLIVGVETALVLKDGNLVEARRAWLRAFHN